MSFDDPFAYFNEAAKKEEEDRKTKAALEGCVRREVERRLSPILQRLDALEQMVDFKLHRH